MAKLLDKLTVEFDMGTLREKLDSLANEIRAEALRDAAMALQSIDSSRGHGDASEYEVKFLLSRADKLERGGE